MYHVLPEMVNFSETIHLLKNWPITQERCASRLLNKVGLDLEKKVQTIVIRTIVKLKIMKNYRKLLK